jgi:upstream activation factor subunit UAF30
VEQATRFAAKSRSKGVPFCRRVELTKRVWAYIREHKLQDAQDRRRIQADDRLRALFDGQDSVTMFEPTKFLNRHLT